MHLLQKNIVQETGDDADDDLENTDDVLRGSKFDQLNNTGQNT